MHITSLTFLTVLVRAYPANLPWDESAEDLLSTSNLNTLDDTFVISSTNTLDDPFTVFSSNTLDDTLTVSSSNALDPSPFLTEYSPEENYIAATDPFLPDLNGEPAENLFVNYNPDSKEEEFSISNLDSSLISANCGDTSIQPDDPLFDYDAADPSTNIFARSVEYTEDPSLLTTDDIESSAKGQSNTRKYFPERTYDLDPGTGPYTRTFEAYAGDGTPLQLGNCPAGKKRTCCLPTNPPFSQCWLMPTSTQALCRFAKNQFCCQGVQSKGGPGIECEEARWIRSRDGRAAREIPSEEEPLESPTSSEYQELFPILKPLPDLTRPDSCLPRVRRV